MKIKALFTREARHVPTAIEVADPFIARRNELMKSLRASAEGRGIRDLQEIYWSDAVIARREATSLREDDPAAASEILIRASALYLLARATDGNLDINANATNLSIACLSTARELHARAMTEAHA